MPWWKMMLVTLKGWVVLGWNSIKSDWVGSIICYALGALTGGWLLKAVLKMASWVLNFMGSIL